MLPYLTKHQSKLINHDWNGELDVQVPKAECMQMTAMQDSGLTSWWHLHFHLMQLFKQQLSKEEFLFSKLYNNYFLHFLISKNLKVNLCQVDCHFFTKTDSKISRRFYSMRKMYEYEKVIYSLLPILTTFMFNIKYMFNTSLKL